MWIIGVLSVTTFLAVVDTGLALCPDQEPGLRRWSDPSTWPGDQKPGLNGEVSVDFPLLLDESPPELHSITIQPNGRLVWGTEGDYSLTLKYILIHGRMDIGSETCMFYRKAHITLLGIRGQYRIIVGGNHAFNEKFIGVAPGGTLEIHAQRKLSWTKLTKTLPKVTESNGLIYHHRGSSAATSDSWKPGLVVHEFDDRTGKSISGQYFYLGGNEPYLSKADPAKLVRFLKSIPYNKIVAMAVQKNMVNDAVDRAPVLDAIEELAYGSITGTSPLRNIQEGDAYVLIAQKGNPNVTQEQLSPKGPNDDQKVEISMTIPKRKLKFKVTSYVNNVEDYKSNVDFRVTSTTAAFPILNLLDDVTTWMPGDKLVLTSTDYDWQQAEEATVVSCPECTHHQVKVEMDSKYTHFGEIINNVDQRGEVALLTRNVLIEGRMEDYCPVSNENCHNFNYDTFGGHIKFVQGFQNVHIEGIELVNMGQQTEIGHYPVHFHVCHDVDDVGNYTHPPYVRHISVHHSFSRCVTIHGTSGVLVNDNVCYDALGHGYFLEDGAEKRNVLDGNIGIATKKGKILISDSRPATFWITNPINRVINNVAAGGEYYGLWYVFPDEPYGPSHGLGFMQLYEAMHTPYLEWENNVAHSNGAVGFYADNKILRTSDATGENGYSPRVRPLEPHSPPAEVRIIRPTMYKNRYQNMWLRGGWFTVEHGSFSDSAVGVSFAKSDEEAQFLIDSVIIGDSKNVGEPTVYWNESTSTMMYLSRSMPDESALYLPRQGFNFMDGPVFLDGVFFSGFKSTDLYQAGAVGFYRHNQNISSSMSSTRSLYFDFTDGSYGNRLYDGDASVPGFSNENGDKGATFRDIDGTLTGYTHAQIVKPNPFYLTKGCYVRSNWNMGICPYRYGKLTLVSHSEEGEGHGHNTPYAIRDDIPDTMETQTSERPSQFLVVLGGDFSYTLNWDKYVPQEFTLRGDGIEHGYWLRFGVCLPRDADFDLFSTSPHYASDVNAWVSVASIQDLDSDIIGDKYFFDRQTGYLFFKFLSYNSPPTDHGNIHECPPPGCPNVRVTLRSGNNLDVNCSSRAYSGLYNRTEPAPRTTFSHRTLGYTSSTSGTRGAGATRPFSSRPVVVGHLGSWGPWSECSKSCDGGVQTRRRWCDSPLPQRTTKSCPGTTTESRKCNEYHCGVNGGWSDFAPWSPCMKVTGCHGYQARRRLCNHPVPSNGTYCSGSDEEVRPCRMC